MCHVQQGKHTFCKPQSFVPCTQICSLSQHNSQQDQPHNIDIKIVHVHIFGFSQLDCLRQQENALLQKVWFVA